MVLSSKSSALFSLASLLLLAALPGSEQAPVSVVKTQTLLPGGSGNFLPRPGDLERSAAACVDLASLHFCEMKKADGMCNRPEIQARCYATCMCTWANMLGNALGKPKRPAPIYFSSMPCHTFDGNKVHCEKLDRCWYDLSSHHPACYPTNCTLLSGEPQRCDWNERCMIGKDGQTCLFRPCEQNTVEPPCTANGQCSWDTHKSVCFCASCAKHAKNRPACDADQACAWSVSKQFCVSAASQSSSPSATLSACVKYGSDKPACNADEACTWSIADNFCIYRTAGSLTSSSSSISVSSVAVSLVPTPAPTPLLPPCAMWGAFLAGSVIADSSCGNQKGEIIPLKNGDGSHKTEHETYVAADNLCKACAKCKAWMFEPTNRSTILYEYISGQINPGNVFVAGLKTCNKAESRRQLSKDNIALLPPCVSKHTYLVGKVVENMVGDPHCGTGNGMLSAHSVTEAYRKCQFCGGCNAWMWSPQTMNVVMYSSVLREIQRPASFYFSAHKGTCKMSMAM